MKRASWLRRIRAHAERTGRAVFALERPRRRAARRLGVEVLESRLALATFLVTNAVDGVTPPPNSLRNAINLANASSDASSVVTITQDVQSPVINLTAGELPINVSLTIQNLSGHPLTIRQTTAGDRVLHVGSDAPATVLNISGGNDLSCLIITGGTAASGNGGGILVDNSSNMLSLSYANVVGNSASGSGAGAGNGGGIYTSGALSLAHSVVGTPLAPNTASATGGGIWASQGVMLDSSHVDSNAALDVGGIMNGTGNVVVQNGSTVDGNSSTGGAPPTPGDFGGGGISETFGSVTVSASEVSFNHTVGMYSGGIVSLLGSVTVTNGSRIIGNSNNGPGGGIAANFGGTVTVSGGSRVDGNTAAAIGGGIVNFAGRFGGVTVSDGSEVSGNLLTNGESLGQAIAVFLKQIAGQFQGFAGSQPPGVSSSALTAAMHQVDQVLSDSNLALRQLTISSPTLPALLVAGGGIGTLQGAPVSISGGSRIDGNFSGVKVSGGNPNSVGIGGGLFAFLSTITVDQSLIAGNIATGDGGGIWSRRSLTITGSTVAGNTAFGATQIARGGGLFIARRGNVSIQNSSIVSNLANFGGGAFNLGRLTIRSSTLARNVALVQGGGIFNRGNLNLFRVRFARNTPNNVFPRG
ncbi:MAG TPA: hypothetical protein VGY53_05530 [Isosphaeraceae bacterium]|nr:hypothetical protein [Isosphaeraceae bacterium]